MLFYWLFLVFVCGAVVGSFLNVCIYRVPLEKSVFWPGSRCGHCYQPIRGSDNIPLVSYWLLRGRCRTCKTRFSPRYFLVELLTALSFTGLFYLEVVVNVNSLVYIDWKPRLVQQPTPAGGDGNPLDAAVRLALIIQKERASILDRQRDRMIEWGEVPWRAWVTFSFHAVLLSFLIVATFCDLDHREIPLAITGPGMIAGLVGAALLPWPWPNPVETATLGMPQGEPWWTVGPHIGPRLGLYPWPVWGPLPDWLPPGSWQLGLATGMAGVMAGTLLLRTVGYLFRTGLGVEALGLGDADLMMMAGAFLGWQPVVAAFFVAALPGVLFGAVQLVVFRDNSLPFGPSLAVGVLLTLLGWHWLGPPFQVVFFHGVFMLILVAAACVFMLVAAYVFRLLRMLRG